MDTSFVIGVLVGFLFGLKVNKTLIRYAEIKYGKGSKNEQRR